MLSHFLDHNKAMMWSKYLLLILTNCTIFYPASNPFIMKLLLTFSFWCGGGKNDGYSRSPSPLPCMNLCNTSCRVLYSEDSEQVGCVSTWQWWPQEISKSSRLQKEKRTHLTFIIQNYFILAPCTHFHHGYLKSYYCSHMHVLSDDINVVFVVLCVVCVNTSFFYS